MISFKSFLIEENKKPNYSGVVLTPESRARLLSSFGHLSSPNFERIAHHMTIKMGGLEGTDHKVGSPVKLMVTHRGHMGEPHDPSVVAVRVSGHPSANATPHITIGVNRKLGGKPVHSNQINNWQEIDSPFELDGHVQEVFK